MGRLGPVPVRHWWARTLFFPWEWLHPNSNLEMTKSTKEFVNKGLAWVIVHDLSIILFFSSNPLLGI
jgi:hypothetical protein